MIDPTETAIAWARLQSDVVELVAGRIASRHKYGQPGWAVGADGLTLTPVTGATPDDAGASRARLEARAYGSTPERAMAVMLALSEAADAWIRGPVSLPSGETALLYWVVPDDTYEAGLDPDIKLHFVRRPLKVNVASTAV